MLLIAAFVIIQNSWVQTQITRKIAKNLSNDLQTNISIGKVEIGFFNRVKLEDVLIEDQAGDTLIYSELISTRIDTLKFRKKQIVLRNLSFENNRINLSKDSTETFNFGFLVRNIGSGPEKDSINIWTFACRNFDFGDMQITYSNNSNKEHTTLEARDLNLNVSNFYSYRDSLSFKIDDLSVSDGKNLLLEHASADVTNVGRLLTINNFNMVSSGSSVTNTDMRFQFYAANDSMNRTFDMNIQVADSEIGIPELGSLIPSLRGMQDKVKLSGIIYGSLNDLKGRNIYLQTGNETSALLDFYINDLFDPENMYLFLDLKNSETSFEDISNIRLPNRAKNRYIRFPDSFYEAGQLNFKGNFSGFLTDFVTFGTLESQMGSLTTDILVMPEEEGLIYYRGNIATTNFQLGELFKQENLGAITFNGSADGQFNRSTEVVSGIFKGSIDSIQFNNYNYKNLSFDGILREKMFDGLLEIQDPNLDFTFLGELNLNEAVPRFDFSLNLRHAFPGKLNLTKNFPATSLAFKMEANFTGNKIDNVNGQISVKEGFYGNRNGEVNLEGIEFRAYQENGMNKLLLQSDFIDAEISGNYRFRDFKNDLFQMVNHYVPDAHFYPENKTSGENKFDYNLNVKEVNPIVNIFVPGLAFEAPFLLYGRIDAAQNILSLNGSIPGVKYGGNWARDVYVGNNASNGQFNSKFRVGELFQKSGLKLYNFTVDSKVSDNVLDNVISWSNFDELTYSGVIKTNSVFSFPDSTQQRHIEIHGQPSRIYIADTLWTVEPFLAKIDSSSFAIEGFKIHHDNQLFAIDGSLTDKRTDVVQLAMKNIDLSYLNKYFDRNIDLEGKVNGYFGFSQLFDEPAILSDLAIDSLYYKKNYMGDISLSSQWNQGNSAIDSELKIVRHNKLKFNAAGTYTPESGALDFDINVDSASVIILSAFMRENFSDFKGLASGKVHLGGTANNILLNGALHGTNAGLTIDVTQVPLTFTDSVYFKDNSIIFDNITVYDDDNNPGIFDGEIIHQNFQNMTYDLNFSSEKIKAMNTTPIQNEQFYGLVMANGRLEITGKAQTVDITCYGTTLAGTDIKISMESQSQLSQYEFLEFVKPETTEQSTFFSNRSYADDGGFNLSITVEATPDADVQLIYNSQIGDIIRARGEGILLFEMDDDGNMSLSGNYNPTQGDYLFTLYNVMNKRFSIEPGGSIVWSGDPYNAMIELQAIYKLKASLYDVFMGRDDLLNQKSRVQVECLINLSDELINPTIAFDIDFPNLEERLKEELSQYFSTEEELNKQILSLIVLGKFYTPEYLRGTYVQNTNMIGTTASEVFSNQLSNWLSQIDEDWDIGINYRPGNEVTDDEIELALSTQIFNDRVTLNGNIGNNTNQYGMNNNSSQIVGDFEMSVKLVRSGKILFKAYNRSNNNLIYETAPYTQGIGLSFKEEYNSIDELFKKLTKLFQKNKN